MPFETVFSLRRRDVKLFIFPVTGPKEIGMRVDLFRKLLIGGALALLALITVGYLFAQKAQDKPFITVYESPT
jgi:hypothetical protein